MSFRTFHKLVCSLCTFFRTISNEQEAKSFLIEYNEKRGWLGNILANSAWDYMTNLTDENAQKCVIQFVNPIYCSSRCLIF